MYNDIIMVCSTVGLTRKERNVIFKDTLDTFYLWLYGVGHMVKDHPDSQRGNLLLLTLLAFGIDLVQWHFQNYKEF